MSEELIRVIGDADSSAPWQPFIGEVGSKLREYFVRTEGIPESESDTIMREAARVLAGCGQPHDLQSRTGLVCGYVQSGKTLSMTAVAALARDNGYRVIIFIAGTTTNLVRQNRERMETQLREAAPEWTWIMLENPKPRDRAQMEGLVQEWLSDQYDNADRRTLFITVMKNHSHLRNLKELLTLIDLRAIPVLVFDDEADQASLNTRPGDPEASATYRNILGLRETLPCNAYLQYTATPQAPLLITRIDALSADFAELVSPGTMYVGGRDMFVAESPYVVRIPPQEIHADGQLPEEPPPSLVRALQVFFVGVAAGRIANSRGHRSMLIHPSKATATHRAYYQWAVLLKESWHRLLLSNEEADKADLLAEFRRAFDDLGTTCRDLPALEEIVRKLPPTVNQTSVTIVNSVDGREVPWGNSYSHILVGGEKLGRGYTVRGLTVTYMPRPPGGWIADTIQQRARFFGYHADYLGYCRVFLHPDVREAYASYVGHEQDMRDRLAEHRGRPLSEWRRVFYLDRRLAPTRRNVLSSPYSRPQLQDGWFAPRAPHMSAGEGARNLALLAPLEHATFTPDEEHPQHEHAVFQLRGVFERILVPWSNLDERDAIGVCFVNCCLQSLLERDPDVRCLVYRMDAGRQRTRRLTRGVVPQLFQGRSSAGAESYPGDRAFSDPQVTTIQVHTLSIEDDSGIIENVPALAIRLCAQEDVLIHEEG